jgi:hypothetical protein
MTRQYTAVTDENTGRTIIFYEENGFKYSFLDDPANSDYQRYLRWLENPDADEAQSL